MFPPPKRLDARIFGRLVNLNRRMINGCGTEPHLDKPANCFGASGRVFLLLASNRLRIVIARSAFEQERPLIAGLSCRHLDRRAIDAQAGEAGKLGVVAGVELADRNGAGGNRLVFGLDDETVRRASASRRKASGRVGSPAAFTPAVKPFHKSFIDRTPIWRYWWGMLFCYL